MKIKYINQKRFKKCKNKLPLPFDFYLPDLNICIEYDVSNILNLLNILVVKNHYKIFKNMIK